MDFFGIGQSVEAVAQVYFRSARATGRTTSLLEGVKDGDRVVFVDNNSARYFERLCKERGVKVECIVVDPADPHKLFERGSVHNDGRNIFDHVWVEQYYMLAIQRAQKDIANFEKETSGYGEEHRKTARRANEILRWQV